MTFFRRRNLNLALSLFAIILLIIVYALWRYHDSREQHLALYTVQRGDITSKATAPGMIVSNRQTVITAPFAGYIKKLYVQTGQQVTTNQALVTVVQSLQSAETAYPIRAPYGGMVSLVNKSEGQFVAQNDADTGFILKIDDLSRLYAVLDVAERDITRVKPGQAVVIKPAASAQQAFHGKVINIAKAPKPQANSNFLGQVQVVYQVKVLIAHPDLHQLYPGMSVISDIMLAHHQGVLLIPHEYLHVASQDKYYVTLDNGKRQTVTIGLQNPRMVEITRGLTAGQKIRQINYFAISDQHE